MLARKRRNKTVWFRRDAVGRWEASGLSQAEFCRRENIPEWALSSWKREFQVTRASEAGARGTKDKYGPPPRDGRQLRSYWKRIVREQAESELSAAGFCREQGLRVATFYKWQRRLAGQTPSQLGSLPKENPFVAVQVPSMAADTVSEPAVEVVLAGGSTVRVTERTPLALLAKLLRALEATC
jgi:hypothetical protein